jgi:hypothetical protein
VISLASICDVSFVVILFLRQDFSLYGRLASNSLLAHIGLKLAVLLPQLPSTGITGICHHTQLMAVLIK